MGFTPLHTAVSENWLEGVRELLKRDANPNVQTENLSMVKDIKKMSPFQMAIYEGQSEMVDMMLDHHADLFQMDSSRNTILHLASF